MPLIPIAPDARKGKSPCGECHIRPGETCDICGAKAEPEPRPFPSAPQGRVASPTTSPVRPAAMASTSTDAGTAETRNGSEIGPVQSGTATDARWNWQWDDKQPGGKRWKYDRADLRAGVICLGSYSRWTDESLLRGGVDPLRPIHAWMYQARYIDGVYNEEPDGWFATVAEARAFVEAEADKMLAAVLPWGAAADNEEFVDGDDESINDDGLYWVNEAECIENLEQSEGGEERKAIS